MEYVKIPGTDLSPSRIGLGTWAMGGSMWGGTDEERSIRTICAALERGITLIDTAPAYRQGRIRAIGVSNYSPEQMDLFRQVAPLHAAQPPYNLFEREAEERVLPYCLWHGIATLTYGALCRGLLSGRMRADTRFGGDDLRRTDPKFQPPRYAQYLRAVATLEHLARARYERSVLALAVRWVLDQPGVQVALWGARSPEQLDPLDEVMGWSLDADTMRTIDAILRGIVVAPVGPEFMAPPARAGHEARATVQPTA